MRRSEKGSGDMRRDENSCKQLRLAETGRVDIRSDEMRWAEKERRHEIGDCGDSRMQ